jgi:hypothetical protein
MEVAITLIRAKDLKKTLRPLLFRQVMMKGRRRSSCHSTHGFRFEAYNLTNSLMWANPNTTPGKALFGSSIQQATTNRGREIQ